MADLAQLVFLASQVDPSLLYQAGLQAVAKGWKRDGPVRFCTLDPLELQPVTVPQLSELLNVAPSILDGVEVDLIQLPDGIDVHRHNQSDSVSVCSFGAEAYEGYFHLDGSAGFWRRLHFGMSILVPRGTPHGFRKLYPAPPLEFINIGYPASVEGDIVYL